MKKFAVLATVVLLGAGTAFAGSVVAPWFLDNAAAGAWPPSAGTATFITVTNTTSSPMTLTITYRDPNGADATPSPNTFILNAYSPVSFRPTVLDTTTEGPAGQAVPDMTGALPKGSARISWLGGTAKDIQGRSTLITGNGATAYEGAYVLPEGP